MFILGLFFAGLPQAIYAAGNISAIWANNGEDKVTQDELRATLGTNVTNPVWDGTKISIFGGRNEVVAFNVILEAGAGAASNISVTFNKLTGPSGATIASQAATGDGVFNWTQRPVELFYVRYLQINGLSLVAYGTYDERHVPQRMRRPWTGNGVASGGWQDRPDHNKYYPDIAVPLELVPTFNIAAGHNQSIWVDVYIPPGTAVGTYNGNFVVQAGGTTVQTIPVQLSVYNFSLPDKPSARTMLYYSHLNIDHRYLGSASTNSSAQAIQIRDRHYMLAHRHRISLIADDPAECGGSGDQPCPEMGPRLDGSLFTAANGYAGPGVGIGNNVYSVGTYGSSGWQTGGQTVMNQHCDAWATWFSQNAPGTEYFLYLIDESTNYAAIQGWAQEILNDPGPGQQMRSLATMSLVDAANNTPALDIPTSTLGYGIPSQWDPLAQQYSNDPRHRFFMYNGHRPATGCDAIEDDGVAFPVIAWAQYKKHVNRWFFWESTYYNNYQGGMGETNVFENAQTFGTNSNVDAILGATGWNYGNGDGVLFYPGTDTVYPQDSYGVNGPFASLRLKHWRRGLQDFEYLTMAAAVNPAQVQNIVNSIIPKVVWEYGVANPSDPTYVLTDISWSNDPAKWETARAQLVNIITGGQGPKIGASLPTPTLNLSATLPVDASLTAGYPSGYSGISFKWAVTQANISISSPSAQAPAQSGNVVSFQTKSNVCSLASYSLSPGSYTISVQAVDSQGNTSGLATTNVQLIAATAADLTHMRVFPNPWRSDKHSGVPVTFDNLPDNSTIKIFTVSAHLVRILPSPNSGVAAWDLTNDSGDKVASGIYIYLVKAGDQAKRGKLAVIK
jgi:hypothetical protein